MELLKVARGTSVSTGQVVTEGPGEGWELSCRAHGLGAAFPTGSPSLGSASAVLNCAQEWAQEEAPQHTLISKASW